MRYPINISRKGRNFPILFFLSRRDTLVQIDDIAYFSLLDLLFILRDEGSGNTDYLLPTMSSSMAPFLTLFQVSMILRDRNDELTALARKALAKDPERMRGALGTYGTYF